MLSESRKVLNTRLAIYKDRGEDSVTLLQPVEWKEGSDGCEIKPWNGLPREAVNPRLSMSLVPEGVTRKPMLQTMLAFS